MNSEQGSGALDMLMALNAGCSGLATIHANSGRDALNEARLVAQTTASDTASWIARHGHLPPLNHDDIAIRGVDTDESVVVQSSIEVQVIGVGGVGVTVTVDAQATAPVSPYRSDR